MRRFIHTASFLPAVLCAGLCGCGGGSKDVKLAPFTGRVMYKNRPVANASITITPEKGSLGFAVTDDNGNFVARTGSKEGVPVGKVTITIEAKVGGESSGTGPVTMAESEAANDPNAAQKMLKKQMMESGKKKSGSAKSLIPIKYSRTESTPLKDIEIASSGKKDFEIVLED